MKQDVSAIDRLKLFENALTHFDRKSRERLTLSYSAHIKEWLIKDLGQSQWSEKLFDSPRILNVIDHFCLKTDERQASGNSLTDTA